MFRAFSDPRADMNVLNPSDGAGHEIAVSDDELALPLCGVSQANVDPGATNVLSL